MQLNNKEIKMSNYDNDLKGAAWVKTAKSGLKYMGGSVEINGQKYFISIFKNTKKQQENHPDYNIVLNMPTDAQNAPVNQNNSQSANNVNQVFNQGTQAQKDPFQDDTSIPF